MIFQNGVRPKLEFQVIRISFIMHWIEIVGYAQRCIAKNLDALSPNIFCQFLEQMLSTR